VGWVKGGIEDDVVYTEQPQSSFFGVAGLTKQLQTIGNTCDSDKNVGGIIKNGN